MAVMRSCHLLPVAFCMQPEMVDFQEHRICIKFSFYLRSYRNWHDDPNCWHLMLTTGVGLAFSSSFREWWKAACKLMMANDLGRLRYKKKHLKWRSVKVGEWIRELWKQLDLSLGSIRFLLNENFEEASDSLNISVSPDQLSLCKKRSRIEQTQIDSSFHRKKQSTMKIGFAGKIRNQVNCREGNVHCPNCEDREEPHWPSLRFAHGRQSTGLTLWKRWSEKGGQNEGAPSENI